MRIDGHGRQSPTARRHLPLLDPSVGHGGGGVRVDAGVVTLRDLASRASLDPKARPAASEAPPPRSVRISVTDRCDYACTYCRPSRTDGYVDSRLSPSEWTTVFRGLLDSGVRRVRLTGGEPLLHPKIVEIVGQLERLGFEDLALTTNASQLARMARPLRDAGLHRLNISIDTLDDERFRRMTRGGRLSEVLEGIDAALECGFAPIKLNTVVVRGDNDDEIEPMTRWAWDRGLVPRFLEVMRIGEGANLPEEAIVPAAEVRGRLASLLRTDDAVEEPDRGPAKYVAARGVDGERGRRVGFITGTSDTFCDRCDRLRVSSEGMLRPCLATDDGVSAADVARRGDLTGFAQRLAEAWSMKPDGKVWKGCTEQSARSISIRAIGG